MTRSHYTAVLAGLISLVVAACRPTPTHLTILCTNDTHSQVEPRDNGLGGYARRMGCIDSLRRGEPDLLLLDCGDFCQGTPYFNIWHGRVEIEALNRMGYDAVTLGNHEFDNGLDTLAAVLRNAQFSVVCANYDFRGTALESIVQPYTILRRGRLRIGVFGIGINPEGLIARHNFAPARYIEPYSVAQHMADTLRQQGCDVVVCLSHLGTRYDNPDTPSDSTLAARTSGIDLIVGGHTHTVFDSLRVSNTAGLPVGVVQCGKAGQQLGCIRLDFLAN